MKKILTFLKVILFIVILSYISYLVFQHIKPTIEVKQTTKTVINQLEKINKLETAQMTITKVIEWKKKLVDLFPSIKIDDKINKLLFNDELLLEVEGTVVAGFDISKCKTWFVSITPLDQLKIILPEPEILYVKLWTWTEVFDRKLWLFTKWDVKLESDIRNKTKETLIVDAKNAWILLEAKKNVKLFFIDLLKKIWITDKQILIEFVWSDL